ncbi:hypothetical protein [Nocardia carnea]|uniref:hypothetical protein n=1 Tax=Nocardia carnea TaxID=37328 RepID=UPI002454A280|nr:hypothetical protein [Nocardia carnea]
MEPIEINAGQWYLRALRADERIDDRPALVAGGITDPGYVARRSAQWVAESHFSWAVCEPTTAELLAEVVAEPRADGTAEVSGWARPGHEPALDAGVRAVCGFVEGAFGLRPEVVGDPER